MIGGILASSSGGASGLDSFGPFAICAAGGLGVIAWLAKALGQERSDRKAAEELARAADGKTLEMAREVIPLSQDLARLVEKLDS